MERKVCQWVQSFAGLIPATQQINIALTCHLAHPVSQGIVWAWCQVRAVYFSDNDECVLIRLAEGRKYMEDTEVHKGDLCLWHVTTILLKGPVS